MSDPQAAGPMRLVRGRHEVAAGARDYRLVVPAVPRARPPLLVVLHGCLQDADDIARGTRLDVAAADGVFVLYPSQDVAANARRCWNWFEPAHQSRDGGEPAILAAMIDHVVAAHGLDGEAVHLVGISAGAAMAGLLAVGYPERFASLTLASGVPWRAASSVVQALSVMQRGAGPALPDGAALLAAMGDAPRAVPVTVVHGMADGVVSVRNAADTARQWVELHDTLRARAGQEALQQQALPRTEQGGRLVDETRWCDAAQRAQVTLLRVHDLGHAWSAGDPSGSFTDPAGPDVSARIVRSIVDGDARASSSVT